MGHVIGIDVGSQSVKALVVSPAGDAVAQADAPCAMSHPAAGWAEQDPADWLSAMAAAVREARERAGLRATDVTMLGLACQVDGLVALDADLRALRPGIIWLDRRATVQCDAFAAAASAEEIIARTGCNPDASHSGPKAMWLHDAEPENYERSRWLAPVGGYLLAWLTGEPRQDHANASSTLLYDISRREWAPELIAHAGLDARRLPLIGSAAEVVGPLRAEAAAALGLSERCRVVTGTGDEHGAALGAGAVAPGIVVDVTGTAEPVAVPAAAPVLDAHRLVETHAHAVDGMLLVENPGFVSGGSTRWWSDMLGISQRELFDVAAQAPAGSDGALFLPTLSGATAPRWNDEMRGCFSGLALNHGPAHLARAVLEGCAHALRDIVDRFAALGLGDGEVRVVGGGARSALWMQIKADVTGRPMRAVLGDHATSAGAAMLAAVGAGHFADLGQAAAAVVRLADEPVLPRAELRDLYDESYAAYHRLYDGVERSLA